MRTVFGLVLAVCLFIIAMTLIGLVSEIVAGRSSLRFLLSVGLIIGAFGAVGALTCSYLRRSS